MAHVLKLYIRDSQLDARYLIVTDLSSYDPNIPLKNRSLFIQGPGYAEAYEVLHPVGGTAAYSSKKLKLSTEIGNLPDGLYTCTLSVNPNSKLYDIAYHFRTTWLEQQLYSLLTRYLVGEFNNKTDCKSDSLPTLVETQVMRAFLLLDGLKANMTIFSDLKSANDQYNEIVNIVNKLQAHV